LRLGGATAAVGAALLGATFVTGHGDAAPRRGVVPRSVPAAASARPSSPGFPVASSCPVARGFRRAFARASEAAGLEPALLVAVAQAESELDPGAVSPRGARGLLQLMPETARHLGVDTSSLPGSLSGGARYLRTLLDRFGSLPVALAAYNAGPTAVAEYGGVPPYRETEGYVARVTASRRILAGCRFR